MPEPVSYRTAEARDLESESQLPRDLMAGNARLRAVGTRYLPKLADETDLAYAARLCLNYLFNGFRRGVLLNRARVFGKPITFGEDVPVVIKGDNSLESAGGIIEDIDRCGNHLQVVAGDWFEEAEVARVAWVLVDCTKEDVPGKAPRPWWKIYTVGEYLGCNNGAHRFRENTLEADPGGGWGEVEVERVRVLYEPTATEPARYEVHVKVKGEGGGEVWTIESVGDELRQGNLVNVKGAPMSRVPLVRLQLDKGLPFEDLAAVCLAFWQSNAAQRMLLQFARQLIIFRSGVSGAPPPALVKPPPGSTAPVQYTPNTVDMKGSTLWVQTADPSGDMKYVEHTGKAIEAGEKDLDRLLALMEKLTLEPMLRRTGEQPTATGAATEAEQSSSLLQGWALRLKDAIEMALQFSAEWLGETSGGSIEIPTMPGLVMNGVEEGALLLKACIARKISRETLWAALGPMLGEDFDPDEEAKRLDEEPEPDPTIKAAMDKLTGAAGDAEGEP